MHLSKEMLQFPKVIVVAVGGMLVAAGCASSYVNPKPTLPSGNTCEGPEGYEMETLTQDEGCVAKLFDIAYSALNQKNFEKAIAFFDLLDSKGLWKATVELSYLSAIGESDYFSKEKARSILEGHARQGRKRAARLLANLWLLDTPEGLGPSLINAYLTMHHAYKEGDAPKVLPGFPRKLREKFISAGFGNLTYSETQDVMTDEYSCQIVSDSEAGLYFGVDMKGLFVGSEEGVLLEKYSESGVRPSNGEFVRALGPNELAQYESQKQVLGFFLYYEAIDGEEYWDLVRRLDENTPTAIKRLYVAYAGTPRFDGLLSELALAPRVLLRAYGVTGERRTVQLELLPTSGQNADFTLFDVYGYFYLNCRYAPLSAGWE